MVGNSATFRLARFGNRRAPPRKENENSGREESLAVLGVEANQDAKPEQVHPIIEDARSSKGAGCRDENTSGTEPEGRYFS